MTSIFILENTLRGYNQRRDTVFLGVGAINDARFLGLGVIKSNMFLV